MTTSHGASPATGTTSVAVDACTRDQLGAEHVVHLLDGALPADHPSYVASTHLVAGASPHTAVAASWTTDDQAPVEDPHDLVERLRAHLAHELPDAAVVVSTVEGTAAAGPEPGVASALGALAEHRARTTGRLARFRGRSEIERWCSIAEVVELSAVDAVEALAGTATDSTTELDLREWARPSWRDGRVVLLVQPGPEALVPFESRVQVPCCSRH